MIEEKDLRVEDEISQEVVLSLEVGVEKIPIYSEKGGFGANHNHRLEGLTKNIRDWSNPPALYQNLGPGAMYRAVKYCHFQCPFQGKWEY